MDWWVSTQENSRHRHGVEQVYPPSVGGDQSVTDAAPVDWEEIILDFLEYLNRDHDWVLDHLDIWQLFVYHRRIIVIKSKEKKGQLLDYYTTIKGMDGMKFTNADTPEKFWEGPQFQKLPQGEPGKNDVPEYADADALKKLGRMFGSNWQWMKPKES